MAKLMQIASNETSPSDVTEFNRRDQAVFELIMRTHNQHLFRIARAILRDSFEAEDVVQEAYIKVFTNLEFFEAAQSPGAWLARVTSNLAISRLRQKRSRVALIEDQFEGADMDNVTPLRTEKSDEMSPERKTSIAQIRELLEREIDNLPDGFREVFVLRVVEEMSLGETAEILELSPQTVKSRLHRARAKIQNSIKSQLTAASLKVFPFAGEHCDRITASTLAKLREFGLGH